MSDVALTGASTESIPANTTPRVTRLPRWFQDYHGGIAAAIYLAVVLWYDHMPLAHLGSVCSCENNDPTQWMWSWKWFIYAIEHGHNPLLTDRIWTPHIFDLAAVTLAPTTAIPGIPLSALFGPVVAYNLMVFAAPVISGWAAYRLCRYVSGAPWPSVLAGYTYGFSAFEIGHMLGHLNLIFVFVPPMLVHLVLRYLDAEISRRRALVGATILLLIEFGLSTELLFDMSFLGVIALIVAYIFAPAHRRRLLEVAAILVVAYLLMAAIFSYYIYQALRGPTESAGEGIAIPNDLLSYIFPTPAFRLGGNKFESLSASFISPSPFEQNAYLGLPLCGILLAVLLSSWRQRAVKILGLVVLGAFVLSLGVNLTVGGHATFNLPFNWLIKRPLFKLIIPSRFGVFVALGAALAAALWLSWALGRTNRVWRWIVGLAAVAFLIPNPGEAGRINSLYLPTFFTTDLYRQYLRPNEVVMTIPFSQGGEEMVWQADTGMYFRLAGGYFGLQPPYDNPALVEDQLAGGFAPPAISQAVPELRSFLAVRHVGAVLIEPSAAQGWPAVLTALHWHLRTQAGGMDDFTPPTVR